MNRLPKEIKNTLHTLYGIDWQQKDLIKITHCQSNFTVKGLIKTFDIKDEDINFVFVKNYIGQYKGLKIQYEQIVLVNELYNLGFNTKSDFEIERKKENCEFVLIQIKKQAIKTAFQCDKTKKLERDFEYMDSTIRLLDVKKNNNYRSRIHFTYNYCGKKNTFDTWIGQGSIGDIKSITNKEFVDKSGYCLYKYRRDLSIRLEKYKLNKAKDMVINSNFVADNNKKIEELLLKKREELIKKMVVADNEKRMFEIVSLSTKLTSYYGQFAKIKGKTRSMFDDTLREWFKFTTIDELQQVYKEFIEELEA